MNSPNTGRASTGLKKLYDSELERCDFFALFSTAFVVCSKPVARLLYRWNQTNTQVSADVIKSHTLKTK